ncbi:MAG: hypothetical protein JWM91_384 [Rhodospirillales bacterium]|nr:hypothetical protein [Rhodospirillales bacterium]
MGERYACTSDIKCEGYVACLRAAADPPSDRRPARWGRGEIPRLVRKVRG